YTRADCPRYGAQAGPSCATAPESIAAQPLPESMDPKKLPMPQLTPEVRELIERVLGGAGTSAETILGGLLTDGPVAPGPAPAAGVPPLPMPLPMVPLPSGGVR